MVDVQAVLPVGDCRRALIPTPQTPCRHVSCEVLVCGGGLGGVAAALAAAGEGVETCLLEETDWLGGQATAQGVSALDEHDWIETFGGTRSYENFRHRIRAAYADRCLAPVFPEDKLNPGACWVSGLGFEPREALAVIEEMTAPYCASGVLKIFLRTKAYRCENDGEQIAFVDAVNLETGEGIRFQARFVIDATELGDLLPLAGIRYRVGAESRAETEEPHARVEPSAHCVQGCTYPFVLERCASFPEDESEPEGYQDFRRQQPYSLKINIHGNGGRPLQYALFERLPGTPGSVWEYRRIVSADRFHDSRNDLSMFNWPGNDYYESSLLDVSPEEFARALQRAKQLSLGFAHWIRKESEHSGKGRLSLRRDVLGTSDGLSKHPYIREARRIVSLKTVVEQDVHASLHSGVRSGRFEDSVGVGFYALDVHHTCDGAEGFFIPTKPFQIPLAALLPIDGGNLIAGGKNIGVTHVTNGCYRLHPVEWNIGESAGVLAAHCVKNALQPRQVCLSSRHLRRLQRDCLRKGIPCSWLIDVPPSHPCFPEIHFLAALAGPPDENDLRFSPDMIMTPELFGQWRKEIQKEFPSFPLLFEPMERWRFAVEVERALTSCL